MKIKIKQGSCLGKIYHNGKARIMVIDSVEIEPEYRHKGFGSILMNKAIEIATKRGVDCVELLVNTDNEYAKRLYKKVGFTKTNKEHYRFIL